MHKSGDIILVPFPFTDLSGNKIRPALILAAQEHGDDMTVCFISSVIDKKIQKDAVIVDEKETDFKKTGLKTKSLIKVTKIATVDKVIALGKMGELDNKSFKKVKFILKEHFNI